MNKKGFTLAEVLMVMAIIGVIAAVTIPAVMSSTRGKEYQTSAAKALSTLHSAMQFRYALEEESMEDYDFSIGAYLTREIDAVTKKRAIAGAKVQGASDNQCVDNTSACKVETQDGMIWSFPGGKASDVGANQCSSPNGCLVWVDTNGLRGPTRNNMNDTITRCSSSTVTVATSDANASGGTGNTDTVSGGVVTSSKCPDMIALRIKDRNVEPADQRTRNIIATGAANISQ